MKIQIFKKYIICKSIAILLVCTYCFSTIVYAFDNYTLATLSMFTQDPWQPIKSLDGSLLVNRLTGRVKFANDEVVEPLECDLTAVRHGQTKGQKYKIFQGAVDLDRNQLDQKGQEQAKEAAQRLFEQFQEDIKAGKEIVLLTSPFGRAKDTAKAFVKLVHEKTGITLKLTEEPLAHEMAYGAWDNKTEQEIEQEFGKSELAIVERYRKDLDATIKARKMKGRLSENFIDVVIRARKLFKKINKLHKGKKVILFSHGIQIGSMKVLLKDKSMLDQTGQIRWRGEGFIPANAEPIKIGKGKQRQELLGDGTEACATQENMFDLLLEVNGRKVRLVPKKNITVLEEEQEKSPFKGQKGMILETHSDDGLIHIGGLMDFFHKQAMDIPGYVRASLNGEAKGVTSPKEFHSLKLITAIPDQKGVFDSFIEDIRKGKYGKKFEGIDLDADPEQVKRNIRKRESELSLWFFRFGKNHICLDWDIETTQAVYRGNRFIAAESKFRQIEEKDQEIFDRLVQDNPSDYYCMVVPFSKHPHHRMTTIMMLKAIYKHNRKARVFLWADNEEYEKYNLQANLFLLLSKSTERWKELIIFNAFPSQNSRREDQEFYCTMSGKIAAQGRQQYEKTMTSLGKNEQIDAREKHPFVERLIEIDFQDVLETQETKTPVVVQESFQDKINSEYTLRLIAESLQRKISPAGLFLRLLDDVTVKGLEDLMDSSELWKGAQFDRISFSDDEKTYSIPVKPLGEKPFWYVFSVEQLENRTPLFIMDISGGKRVFCYKQTYSIDTEQAIEQLYSDNWVKRRNAVEHIGRKRLAEFEGRIVELLLDEKIWVRKSAAQALTNMRSKKTFNTLLKSLEELDFSNMQHKDVIIAILEAMRVSGDMRCVDLLGQIAVNKDNNLYIRETAVKGLKFFPGKETEKYLLAILQGGVSVLANEALISLAEIAGIDVVEEVENFIKGISFHESEFEKNAAREGFGDDRTRKRVSFYSGCIRMIQRRAKHVKLVLGGPRGKEDRKKYYKYFQQKRGQQSQQKKPHKRYWLNPEIQQQYMPAGTTGEVLDRSQEMDLMDIFHPDVEKVKRTLKKEGIDFQFSIGDDFGTGDNQKLYSWRKDGVIGIPTTKDNLPVLTDGKQYPVGGETVSIPGRDPLMIISEQNEGSSQAVIDAFPWLRVKHIPQGFVTAQLDTGEIFLKATSHIDCVFNALPRTAHEQGKAVILVDPLYYNELLLRVDMRMFLRELEDKYDCEIVKVDRSETFLNPANFIRLPDGRVLINRAPKTVEKMVKAGVKRESLIMLEEPAIDIAVYGGSIGCFAGIYCLGETATNTAGEAKGHAGGKKKMEMDFSVFKGDPELLKDTVKLLNKENKEKFFIGMSSGSIKGYEQGIMQHNAINPLITHLQRYFTEQGVDFIFEKETDLAGKIEKYKEENPKAKGIVLGGLTSVAELMSFLAEDNNVLVAEINNKNLTEYDYMPLINELYILLRVFRKKLLQAHDRDMEDIIYEASQRGLVLMIVAGKVTLMPIAPTKIENSLKNMYELEKYA